MMEWLKTLHSAEGISRIIEAGGLLALVAIVFAETGLLVGFFLPGDSLLITSGVLANPANPHHVQALDIVWMNILLMIAAIVGDQVGYMLGHKTGDAIWDRPDSRFFKKKHLMEAKAFYEKYGGFSVVAARYVPIVRTFVPFVAGVARMPYRKFVFWNISGGILWVTSLLWIGYYLGQTQLANRLDKIIVVVIFVSILPMIIGGLKRWLGSRSAAPGAAAKSGS
jgi:membrane-associated protein